MTDGIERTVKMGRPPAWSPADVAEDRDLRALWKSSAIAGGYIIDVACVMMGEDEHDSKARERVRHRLFRRYGRRGATAGEDL